jgi:hypothetical protein
MYEEMRKYLVIQYMRWPLVIYDFATAPFWISLCMRNFFFLFISFSFVHVFGQKDPIALSFFLFQRGIFFLIFLVR